MVIKILAGGSSFKGVLYSEKKEEKKEAKLLKAENFPLAEMTTQDRIDYLDAISKLKPNVKNKQFHVSISTKGREHSFEELKQVADDYMKFMGYEKTPYLIYSHTDTPNNHVHIISSRIDVHGKQISDSLEKTRTQRFIKNKLKIDFSNNVDGAISEAMKYNFKSVDSLSALLKKQGYRTKETKEGLQVIKSGEVRALIPKRKLRTKLYVSKLDYAAKNKIKAQLYKYSSGTDFDKLQGSMRKQFGLEMIYDYSTPQEEHNQTGKIKEVIGYTLLDHKNNTAYRDTDLLSPEKLKEQFESIIGKEELARELQQIRSEPRTYYLTKEFLKDLNLTLNYNGEIKTQSGEPMAKLDAITMDKLKYNQRVLDARESVHSTAIQENTLAKIYRIKIGDVQLNPSELTSEEKERYRQLILSYLDRNTDSPRTQEGFQIYNTPHGHVLIDRNASVILDIEKDLDIEIKEQKSNSIPRLHEPTSRPDYPSKDYSSALELLSMEDMEDNGENRKKKKKGKIQQNINN